MGLGFSSATTVEITRWQNWSRQSIQARGDRSVRTCGQGPFGSLFDGGVVVTARTGGCLIKEVSKVDAEQLGMSRRQLIVPF